MSKRKTVLLTGATSGVGREVATRLLAMPERYHLIATGRSHGALLELQNAGATVIPADMANAEEIEELIEQTGSPDIVIHSAGVGTFALAHELTDSQIEAMLDVNVLAPMKLTKRLLPGMLERKDGHIIFIGSQAGKVATPKASVYAASKHALIGYVNALRMEVAPHGIQVSAIHPGPIDTPFLDHADATGTYRHSVGAHLLTTETVAEAVVKVMTKPVREINLPGYMGWTSKLYGLAPGWVERLGKRFFDKK
ncbi:SDR family NAD(P)-dependent oxidoreductase [Sporosarcina cyprini]|uniref:SDR family NAD(P)-dependent oxidoreductase n=1 Tax=Sporosarcina cyprini TaxID=2910523 RepID=UPI001EE08C86|nr:SDR family NAD(P)-dependent oxidoreductase [Sporosarcina cyprini]MCG3088997.1 SDR family NAD(P)-dependent oxidoreductase [Sporosarcina cyprini]